MGSRSHRVFKNSEIAWWSEYSQYDRRSHVPWNGKSGCLNPRNDEAKFIVIICKGFNLYLWKGDLVYELGFGPQLAWELGFEAWELGFGPKLGWKLGFRTPLQDPHNSYSCCSCWFVADVVVVAAYHCCWCWCYSVFLLINILPCCEELARRIPKSLRAFKVIKNINQINK